MSSGFVLHVAPWQETSARLELLTFDDGRLGCIARGARSGRSALRVLPFCTLDLDWSGRGELKSLRRSEVLVHRWLAGNALACGMYLNELLMRVLQRSDPCPELANAYGVAVDQFAAGASAAALEVTLRMFEFALLRHLGIEPDLGADADGQPVRDEIRYRYHAGSGLVRVAGVDGRGALSGAALLALAGSDWSGDARRAARAVTAAALAPLLGDRPLVSRSLWRPRTRVDA